MTKNGEKATIREVYTLLEGQEKRLNERIDTLENNHLKHLHDKIEDLEKKVWVATGGLAVLMTAAQYFLR